MYIIKNYFYFKNVILLVVQNKYNFIELKYY